MAEISAHAQRVIRLAFDERGRMLSFDSAGVVLGWDLARAERPGAELLAEARARFGG